MRRALLLVLLLLALAPAAASAREPTLWATVNVCNTEKQPDAIGIRASMPGVPKGAKLTVRFRVQYRTADRTSDDGWEDVEGADSGWRPAGAGIAKGVAVESGWSFTFAHPPNPVTLRGVVRFRWRRGDQLPRQAELPTEAGHRSIAGADPPGYSAATCELGS
jgi:hypothetical protein